MTTRSLVRRTAFAAALSASVVTLTACDPPPAQDLILGPQQAAAFTVEKASPPRAGTDASAPFVVRFTQTLDPRSLGSRSIRVTRADGRHPVRVRAWADGRELRIAPLTARGFPAGEALLLRLDGAPSPRALRSSAGEPLARAFETLLRAGSARQDLVGPRLVESLPRDGAADVAPGSSVELTFSEPLARGSIVSGDAVTLRVDGRPVAVRLALSGDGSMIVVHPATPLPPDRRVDVELHGCLLDVAGNPLDGGSVRSAEFHTRATSLHELAEDFVDSGRADTRATSCGWDDPETPGSLVARTGTILVAPDSGDPALDLGDATNLHFQLLVPAADIPSGLASALRIEFADAPADARLLIATGEAGATSLDAREPSFVANRAASQLRTVARVADAIDLEAGASHPFVDIAFEEPLRLEAGRPILLDVHLEVTAGARVAAYPDDGLRALVEGSRRLAPAASLLVAPAVPQARSLWYDTGVASPGWLPCSLSPARSDPGVRVVADFQCAPPGRDGGPDAARASPWERDLSRLPAYQFVRFRLRFEGTPESGVAARIDRIVLPYER